ncbi:pimeloyl-ACP methyl ester carboxylesterase [Angulomicrobium tetraedrale]|uniref:Pimeloyl-ACP methyl ester carboxylesterase n=1 Tax=Ancylobacter tetraedralis TaxID=217068 RepID=A0A839Z9A9_9HYPH|nr:alpha/beta hydrolase [Ancylobacter tetraedralis]MBB3771388.1 pimeloyl-ACP methyl ester carboxylesterase [Ancylobacter tetraedralis]
MPTFSHNGLDFAYLDEGEGEPVLLIHGFASTKEINWVGPGWMSTLVRAGRRAIAFDNRGHGASTKLYEREAYDPALMAQDALALMDHLGLPRADVMGYSMGGRIAACLALEAPERVRSLILGGIGIHLVEGAGLPVTVAEALLAPSLEHVTDPTGRTFRTFAEVTKSDRQALAACIYGSRRTLTREEVGRIGVPTLIAIGTKDAVSGAARPLAALIPGAQVVDIPDRDHMLAVGDKVFKEAALAFLDARP